MLIKLLAEAAATLDDRKLLNSSMLIKLELKQLRPWTIVNCLTLLC